MSRTSKIHAGKNFRLESLEMRALPTVSLSGTTLRILGGAGNDTALVSTKVIGGVSKVEVNLNGVVRRFNTSAVQEVFFNGFAGNDVFTAAPTFNIRVVAHGGAGNDVLTGGAAGDAFHGEGGNDVINGRGGDDWIHGEGGNDVLYGGNGNDWIYGYQGDDFLFGQGQNDNLFGGAGLDRMYGGFGEDNLVSLDGFATDLLYGEGGRDSFWRDQNGTRLDRVLDARPNEISNTHSIKAFENGADRTLDGDALADPSDGTFYKNFGTHYLFSAAGPTADDIDQNKLGDCWIQAALAASAQASPNSIRQLVADLGDGTFAVRLGGKYYRVDADLPTKAADSTELVKGGLGQGGTLWGAIVEKAYAIYAGGRYSDINGGLIKDALATIGATAVGMKNFAAYGSGAALLEDLHAKLSAGLAVGAGGIATVPTGTHLVANHAYTVIRVNYENGTATSVTLRNPWAKDGAGNDDGADDGYVTVTGDQLFQCGGGRVQWGTPVA
ncbi:MAG: C2 family cysteine protease [Gemmataceae bacterium]